MASNEQHSCRVCISKDRAIADFRIRPGRSIAGLAACLDRKHETAKRLAQRIKTVLDVAKSKGFREGENPVTTIRDARVLPQVKQKVQHHKAMYWA